MRTDRPESDSYSEHGTKSDRLNEGLGAARNFKADVERIFDPKTYQLLGERRVLAKPVKGQGPAGTVAAEAMRAGEPATGTVAMDLAEAHRQHLSRWFYDCDHQMHRGLAELYVSDPRYIAEYDKIEPGFSGYVHDAILANADRGQG